MTISLKTIPIKTIPLRQYWHLLRQYLAPQWQAALLMAFLLLCSIGLQLLGPQLIRRFIDALTQEASSALLRRNALLFLAVTFSQQGMNVLARYWSQRVAWTATNALRADLAAHIMRLDLRFHQTHAPGELMERVDGDVRELAEFFSGFAIQVMSSTLLLAAVLVAVWWVEWQLGLAFSLFTVGALLLLHFVRQAGIRHWQADREESARLNGFLGEVLTATEDLRANGAVSYSIQRFFGHLQRWLPLRLKASFWGQSVMTTTILLLAVADALVYGLSGRLYWSGALSLGTVYLVVAYMVMLATPLEELRHQMQNLQQADAAIHRVNELLATRSTLSSGTARVPTGPVAVTLTNVSFAYNSNGAEGSTDRANELPMQARALQQISFHLPASQSLGVLGHTGSGKTTLTRLLFRFYDPQQGSITLGGVEGRQSDLARWRSRIGLVTQEVQIFEATLRDNITLFDPSYTDSTLLAILEQLHLAEWLMRLPDGLATRISTASLSAGEAQMVALARLFLKDPGLIILDEASSRLDPTTERLLHDAVTTLIAGRTVISIAHHLETVAHVDQLLILSNGEIAEYGKRSALEANEASVYNRLLHAGSQEIIAA